MIRYRHDQLFHRWNKNGKNAEVVSKDGPHTVPSLPPQLSARWQSARFTPVSQEHNELRLWSLPWEPLGWPAGSFPLRTLPFFQHSCHVARLSKQLHTGATTPAELTVKIPKALWLQLTTSYRAPRLLQSCQHPGANMHFPLNLENCKIMKCLLLYHGVVQSNTSWQHVVLRLLRVKRRIKGSGYERTWIHVKLVMLALYLDRRSTGV